MINLLTKAENIEELGMILVENWENNDLDNISISDMISFRKFLLSMNMIKLAKKMDPLENFTFNRFNFSRAILSEVSTKKVIYQKLKFAIWHRLITNKIYKFIIKTTSDNTKSKLNDLLNSLKSISNLKKATTRREMSLKFMILSDLASQLGFQMFSLISIKKSVSNDPDFVDAALFMGKAYIELGQEFSRRDKGWGGTYQYNFEKSKEILSATVSKLPAGKKQLVNNLLNSVNSILDEITTQRKKGNRTVVQVEVEKYLKNTLEEMENSIIKEIKSGDMKFASTIAKEKLEKEFFVSIEDEKTEEQFASKGVEKRIVAAKEDDTLSITSKPELQQMTRKPGKLFDIYSKQTPPKKETTDKRGSVSSNEIGYKLKLEDILRNKIDEHNRKIKK